MARPLLRTFVLFAVLSQGCSTAPVVPPNHNIQDAHDGGNIVRFNDDSSLLLSGGWGGLLRLWAPATGRLVTQWPAHEDSIEGATFINEDTRLLTAGFDGALAKWELDGTPVQRVDTPAPITTMVADDAEGIVVTGHADGAVRLWHLSTLKPLREYPAQHDHVKTVAWHGPGRQLASGGTEGRVYAWHLDTSPRRLADPPADAWTLAFSPDGTRLSGGGWFHVFVWDLVGDSLAVLDTEHGGIITGVDYSPDGGALASISRQTDADVLLLDPATGKVLTRLQPHGLCGADVRFSPNGRYLATTSDDASVRIWDLAQPLPETTDYRY